MHLKGRVCVAFCVFIFSYILFLFLWVHVKSYYGFILNKAGAYAVSSLYDMHVMGFDQDHEVGQINLSRPVYTSRGLGDLLLEIKVNVSNYSFNVPLTLALILSLYPIFHWSKLPILETLCILIGIHFLYVFSYCNYEVYRYNVQANLVTYSEVEHFMVEYFWMFMDNMVIRFEPFLLVVYLWIRMVRFDNYRFRNKPYR